MFDPDSRYHQLPTRTFEAPSGRQIAYVSRRFLPQPNDLTRLEQATMVEKDRLDLMAARVMGDPNAWWRLPDGNLVQHPDELEVPGRLVWVTIEAP